MKVTRAQLATLTRYAASGGTFGSYLSNLKSVGLITELARDEVTLTEAGLAHLGFTAPPEPQSRDEFLTMWFDALRLGERKMLTALLAAYPRPLTREALAAQVEMTASGGTFGSYLSTLKRNGLIEVDGNHVQACALPV